MLDLSRTTILIVDFPGASKLRERLLSTGASLHVVKPASALIWGALQENPRGIYQFRGCFDAALRATCRPQRPADHRDGRCKRCRFCFHVVALNSCVGASPGCGGVVVLVALTFAALQAAARIIVGFELQRHGRTLHQWRD